MSRFQSGDEDFIGKVQNGDKKCVVNGVKLSGTKCYTYERIKGTQGKGCKIDKNGVEKCFNEDRGVLFNRQKYIPAQDLAFNFSDWLHNYFNIKVNHEQRAEISQRIQNAQQNIAVMDAISNLLGK